MSRWTFLHTPGRRKQSVFHRTLTHCTEGVQPGTRVTVAVILRDSSGTYLDVAFLFGFAVSWLGLLLILYLPDPINPYLVPLDVVLLFFGASWLCARTPLRAWLTPRRRQRRQVKTAAHAAFVEEGVYHAPDDKGLLIFWSRMEKRVEVVAGTGINTAVPLQEFHAAVHALRRAANMPKPRPAFLAALHQLGQLLAQHLPANTPNHHARQLPGGSAQ